MGFNGLTLEAGGERVSVHLSSSTKTGSGTGVWDAGASRGRVRPRFQGPV